MTKYAVGTTVNPEQTLADIQRLVKKYGCESFGFVQSADRASIAFELHRRRVRFTLPLPSPNDTAFTRTPQKNMKRSPAAAREAYEQEVRSRWRALMLAIKAKLESVESGIETFEEAFMAQLVLPSGQTMYDWAEPQIEKIYAGGQMPPLLGDGGR